jgi:uncharacterized protein (DUF2141 family)
MMSTSGTMASVPQAATLDVSVTGLRSAKGNVLVCMTANPKFFPACDKDPKRYRLTVAAADAGSIALPGVAPGTYALAMVHDENANNKMDMRLFVPREGFGFSRNPKIGMGPPSFQSVKFAVGADDVALPVRMKYLF